MPKEIEVEKDKNLYTAWISFISRRNVIHQFFSYENDPVLILKKWAKIAMRKITLSRIEKKNLVEELNNPDNNLFELMNSKNAWEASFLLDAVIKDSDLSTLIIVKTANSPTNTRETAYNNKIIRAKYAYYRKEYEELKTRTTINMETLREGKQHEQFMLYWKNKNTTAARNTTDRAELYTIVLLSETEFYANQVYLEPGQSISELLKKFAEQQEEDLKRIFKENYQLVLHNAQNEVYQLLPVEGVVNVWTTYYTIEKLSTIFFVVKTEQ